MLYWELVIVRLRIMRNAHNTLRGKKARFHIATRTVNVAANGLSPFKD